MCQELKHQKKITYVMRFEDNLKSDSTKLFEKFGKELARNNLIGKEGTIIDATIVEAPIQHNSKNNDEPYV